MQTSPPPHPALAEFYRFSLLLTGDAQRAEYTLADTLAEAEAHLAQVRSETGRKAWLVQRLRQRCQKNYASGALDAEPPASGLEAAHLARRFHELPEPERSALALFYLDLFTVVEIAELLQMDAATFSETLAAARRLLAHALRTPRDDAPAEP